MSTSLITGFPGFIGARLVRALLDDDPELNMVALVEPKMADKAREHALERLEVIEGDITDRRLKLSDEDYERLTGQVTQVYHLAAIYDLAVPIQAAQAVNVDGTGNILDFCLACAPALSTSTSCRSASASRTTTSPPSSRPRCGCASRWTASPPRSTGRR